MMFKCQSCESTFKDSVSLRIHLVTFSHSIIYECIYPHSIFCQLCEKNYKDENSNSERTPKEFVDEHVSSSLHQFNFSETKKISLTNTLPPIPLNNIIHQYNNVININTHSSINNYGNINITHSNNNVSHVNKDVFNGFNVSNVRGMDIDQNSSFDELKYVEEKKVKGFERRNVNFRKKDIVNIFGKRIPKNVLFYFLNKYQSNINVIPKILLNLKSKGDFDKYIKKEKEKEKEKVKEDKILEFIEKRPNNVTDGRIKVHGSSLEKLKKFETKMKNYHRNFECVISKDIMENPIVLVESLQVYEEDMIITWLQNEKKKSFGPFLDPANRKELSSCEHIANKSLKNVITKWKELNIVEDIEKTKGRIIEEPNNFSEDEVDSIIYKFFLKFCSLRDVFTCKSCHEIYNYPIILLRNGFSYSKKILDISQLKKRKNVRYIQNIALRNVIEEWKKIVKQCKMDDPHEKIREIGRIRIESLENVKSSFESEIVLLKSEIKKLKCEKVLMMKKKEESEKLKILRKIKDEKREKNGKNIMNKRLEVLKSERKGGKRSLECIDNSNQLMHLLTKMKK